jgi:hypothetical protein
MCEWLGLYINSQSRRLRAEETLSEALVLTQIETSSGTRAVNVLEAWAIPLWLAGMRPDKRPLVYRERLQALRRDALVALSKQFFHDVTEDSTTPKRKKPAASAGKSGAVQEARQGVLNALEALWQAEDEQRDTLEQKQQTMEERLRRLEGRPVPTQPVASQALVGWAPLAGEQQRVLLGWLRAVQRQTGVPLEMLALEVADYCGADRVSAIPQAAWPEAVAWVTRRLGI